MEDFLSFLSHEFSLPFRNPVMVFSLILGIILMVPMLLKRLNLPGVIGLILCGVLVGPHAFHVLERDSAIELFSTIGLLYIMFIAGLELDLAQFKLHRYKSILFGFLTYITTALLIFPVCYFVFDYSAFVSFLIGSMLSTHTLLAYPIVSKLGMSKNPAVAITVGGTILVDSGVLILLAVLMGQSDGGADVVFWLLLIGRLILFGVVMFWVIPWVSRRFLDGWMSDAPLQYVFVLFIVFFSAFLAEICGLEAIVGAFIAGLSLNRLIPSSSVLMTRIEFIGNALFIPFFLLSVGMLVDIKVIMEGPMTIVLALVFSALALFGKWLAAFISQVSFKFDKLQRKVMFGLSGARVAATLAIVMIAYEAGLFSVQILNAAIIVILISCIVASLVTEKAAKAMAIQEDLETPLAQADFKADDEQILVPVANVKNIGKLFDFSVLLKEKSSPNPITILSVVHNDENAKENILRNRKQLDEYLKEVSDPEVKVNVIATINHSVAKGIDRVSREIIADLIVLGWPKPGIIEKILGEKWASVIHNVDKTIFIANFEESLLKQKRMVLITPPFVELESGFEMWIQKISKLSREMSIGIVHYGAEATGEAISEVIQRKKLGASFNHEVFSDWEDFLILSRSIQADDLIVLVSARKGSLSYLPLLEGVPVKLEKYFRKNNKIIVFPKQSINEDAVSAGNWNY